MDLSFYNKVIWITGSSSGIGEACAYRLAENGAKLILTALEEDLLQKVKKRCIELGTTDVSILPFDLSNIDNLEALAEQAWSTFGYIDILYNNAGISQRATVIETKMEVVYKIMNVNYFAPVILTKTILPKMIERGGGQIAVTTSIAGRFGFPMRSAYCSSKHALYGFFETVQAENLQHNVYVTFVCPGRVKTNISFYALEKDGKQHGILDPGQAGGVTAEQAANKIVKAFAKKKREILVGRKELIMLYIKRFLPMLSAKLARKIKSM